MGAGAARSGGGKSGGGSGRSGRGNADEPDEPDGPVDAAAFACRGMPSKDTGGGDAAIAGTSAVKSAGGDESPSACQKARR